MKIGVVGTGFVGSTAAYTLAMQAVGSELVLVDHQPALAQAHGMDILHAVPFSHPVQIRSGDIADLHGAQLVVVAAGVNQQPGETRLALLQRNAGIFSALIPQIVQAAPDAVLIIATNPLDIMTHIATRIAVAAGLPASRVIGTGTMLDTARFRALLGEKLGIASESVHGYVLGEHGDSEVLVWSSVHIGGIPLADFAAAGGIALDDTLRAAVDHGVRRAAYQIIQGKGATYFGIASAITALSRAVLFDERCVYTVSAMHSEVEGIPSVSLSLPGIIGRNGLTGTLKPVLNAAEHAALQTSASVILQHIQAMDAAA